MAERSKPLQVMSQLRLDFIQTNMGQLGGEVRGTTVAANVLLNIFCRNTLGDGCKFKGCCLFYLPGNTIGERILSFFLSGERLQRKLSLKLCF